ncbi:hypothetical protein E2C01_071921 [Portunus trituberculatus]|uniref:Uncharacterized protein n=1 Tax=Portunus trituberculatus TaxID=210409 RepID=A0A5B7I7J8_PORTR|nr:hypothetical protein [Portunus trituberculatus]
MHQRSRLPKLHQGLSPPSLAASKLTQAPPEGLTTSPLSAISSLCAKCLYYITGGSHHQHHLSAVFPPFTEQPLAQYNTSQSYLSSSIISPLHNLPALCIFSFFSG